MSWVLSGGMKGVVYTGSWSVCEPSSMGGEAATATARCSEPPTERCRDMLPARAGRVGLGRGDGGMEGETTVMGGTSMEGAGAGDRRSEPGRTAGVVLKLVCRTYGEVPREGTGDPRTEVGCSISIDGTGDVRKEPGAMKPPPRLVCRAYGEVYGIPPPCSSRREPGATKLPPRLACRAYGEVYGVALPCSSVSGGVGSTYCVASLDTRSLGTGISSIWLSFEADREG